MTEAQLIEKVRVHDVLYNTKHKSYRDFNVRQRIWEEIGETLNMPGQATKEMWDKLRRCYMNARHRYLDDIRSGGFTKKKNSWKFEEEMAFLLPFIENRKAQSNVYEAYSIHTMETPQFQMELQGSEANLDENDGESQQSASGWVHQYQDTPQSQYKKRKESGQHQLDNTPVRKKKCDGLINLNNLEGLDEIDLFFLSMSRMTKQLPKMDQSRIKFQLSNMVLSAEMTAQDGSSDVKPLMPIVSISSPT